MIHWYIVTNNLSFYEVLYLQFHKLKHQLAETVHFWKFLIMLQALKKLNMEYEAELITHIIHQLNFEFIIYSMKQFNISRLVSSLLNSLRSKYCQDDIYPGVLP